MAVAAEATETPTSVPTPPPSSGEPRPTPPPLPPRPEASPAATAPAPAAATAARAARARALFIPPWRGAGRGNSAAAGEQPRVTVADRTDTVTSSPPTTTTTPEAARPSPIPSTEIRPTVEEPRGMESRTAWVRTHVIPSWAGGTRDNSSAAATATATAAVNRPDRATTPPPRTTAPEEARPSPVSTTAVDARPTYEEPRARESRVARVRAYVIPPWAGGPRDNTSTAATATAATSTAALAEEANRAGAATPPPTTVTAPEAARPSPASATADARPTLEEPRARESTAARVRTYVIPAWAGGSRDNSSAAAVATPATPTTPTAAVVNRTDAATPPAPTAAPEAARPSPISSTADARPSLGEPRAIEARTTRMRNYVIPPWAGASRGNSSTTTAATATAASSAATPAEATTAEATTAEATTAEATPAEAAPAEATPAASAAVTAAAPARAPERELTPEEAQAIMDAADMAAAEEVVAANEAADAFAVAQAIAASESSVALPEAESDPAGRRAGDGEGGRMSLALHHRVRLARERASSSSSDLVGAPATMDAAGTRPDSGWGTDGDLVRGGRVSQTRQGLRRFASSPGQQQATGQASDAETELDSASLTDLDEGSVVLVQEDRAALPRERGSATIDRDAAGTRLDSGSRSDGDLVRGGRVLRTRQVLRRFASSPGQQQSTGRASDAETELDSASLTDLDEGNVVLVQEDRAALPRERGPAAINRDAARTRLDSGSRSDGDLVRGGRVLRTRQVLRRFASSPGQQQATGRVSDAETELDLALQTDLDEGNVVLVQQDRAALPRERGPATRDAAGTRLDSGWRSDGDLVRGGRVLRARQVLRRFASSPGQQQATGRVIDAETELDSALLADLDERYVVLVQQDRVALPREREASMSSEQATSRRASDDPEMELDSGSQTDEGGDGDAGRRSSLTREQARLPRGRTMSRSRDLARGRAQDDASSAAVPVVATERTRRTQSSPPVLERPPPVSVRESGDASDTAVSGSDAEEQVSPTTQVAATQTDMEGEEEAPESSPAAAVADAQPETTEGGEEEALESPTAAQVGETQPEEEGKTGAEVETEEEEEAEADDAGGVALGGSGGTVFPIVREDPDSGAAAFRCDSCAECQSLIVDASAHRDAVGMKGKVSAGLNSERCRNCWRVVCDSCIGTCWARTMVPKMYTRDSDSHRMRICKTCHCAMEMFRKSLLLGRVEEAMAAYGTGCVNLDTPYTTYHGELPVHCAAAGGNVVLLSWLVDELGCSLFVDEDLKKPLRDLRNLTVLGAAAVNAQVQTMRYLVNTKRCSLFEITHLPTMKKALEACLHVSPEAQDEERSSYVDRGGAIVVPAVFGAASAFDDEDGCCIVCFDNEVACTLVPCGHHCCCRDCAGRLTYCPVCRARITEMIKAIPV